MTSPQARRRSGASNRRRRPAGAQPRAAPAAPAPTRPARPHPRSCGPRPRRACPRSPSSACPSRSCGRSPPSGFTDPFPIQAATLPDALAGRDLLGRGQTGSGKTLAFGLAVLARLAGDRARPRRPRGLVLVPTRELATQVVDALLPFAKALGLSATSVVGGMSFNRQSSELQRGVDVLVATPGRLADHLDQGTCDLGDVTITAIDEADRMADMGFLPQVRRILDHTPSDGQRLLFSATLDGDVAHARPALPAPTR